MSSYLIIPSSPGRFLFLTAPGPAPETVVSVLDYGATGDGVTDDAAAIGAALAAAASGDVVFVPAGDYRIGSPIVMGTSGVTLRGQGPSSIIRLLDDSLHSAIVLPQDPIVDVSPFTLISDIVIEDLTLDGNHNPSTATSDPALAVPDYFGIYARHVAGLAVRGVTIKRWPSDGMTISNGYRPLTDLLVENCRIQDCRRSGIHVGFVDGGIIRENVISDVPSQWWGGVDPYATIVALELSGPETRAYDFGTSGSPVAAGYVKVTPASAYDAGAGFGWLPGTVAVDAIDRAIGTDLTRDFCYTQERVFAVDLADGDYTVSVTMGDLGATARDQMRIFVQGEFREYVTTAAGALVTRVYAATVSDGQLKLRLLDHGPASAHSIDVEVEGFDSLGPDPHAPYVRDLLIEDNILMRAAAATAGNGVAVQPAYGPIDGVTIRRNVVSGHQIAVESTGWLPAFNENGAYGEVASVVNLAIEDNWFTTDSARNVTGYPGQFAGTSGLTISGNVANDRTDGGFSGGGVNGAYNCGDCLGVEITGNTIYLTRIWPDAIAKVYGACDGVTIAGNLHRTTDDLDVMYETTGHGTPANVTVSGNTALPASPWDRTLPPAPTFDLEDGDTVAAATVVTVTATDADSSVARVFFLVDGLIRGISDAAPHTFTLDPADYPDGAHTLSARAIDSMANFGDEASIAVTIGAVSALAYAIVQEGTDDEVLQEGGDELLQETN